MKGAFKKMKKEPLNFLFQTNAFTIMAMELEEFHMHVGEILMYCQCIEHDVKYIYAFMADGGFKENMIRLEEERLTLGQIVHLLKEYDQSWEEPFLSEEDYETLFEIVHKRNYYAHHVYLSFCYLDDEEDFNYSFERESKTILKDLEVLSKLYDKVEDKRLEYMKNDLDLRYES